MLSFTHGNHLCCAHAEGRPSDYDWDFFVELIVARGNSLQGVIAYTPTFEGAPDKRQIRALVDAWRIVDATPPVAVISRGLGVHLSVRAIGAAIGNRIRVFSPDKYMQALEFANARGKEARGILRSINEHAAQIGLPPLGDDPELTAAV